MEHTLHMPPLLGNHPEGHVTRRPGTRDAGGLDRSPAEVDGHAKAVRKMEVLSYVRSVLRSEPGLDDLLKYWFCMTIPSQMRSVPDL